MMLLFKPSPGTTPVDRLQQKMPAIVKAYIILLLCANVLFSSIIRIFWEWGDGVAVGMWMAFSLAYWGFWFILYGVLFLRNLVCREPLDHTVWLSGVIFLGLFLTSIDLFQSVMEDFGSFDAFVAAVKDGWDGIVTKMDPNYSRWGMTSK